MIIDERTYTVQHGKNVPYIEALRDIALPAMKQVGYDLGGIFTSESGMLNQVVHYWKWESLGQRQEVSHALYSHKDFSEYRKVTAGMLLTQENRLLEATDLCAPFSHPGGGGDLAIVDARTYTLTYGSVAGYVQAFKAFGLPVTDKHGWPLVGYFYTASARLHQVVHLWYWKSHAVREKTLAATAADPAFGAYRAQVASKLIAQENRILVPLPFSPLK